MSLFEIPQINPDVPVRDQLFDAVHTIAANDGPLLFDRQTSDIPHWEALYGEVTLKNLRLSQPLHKRKFDIISAEIYVPHRGEEFGITINRATKFTADEQGYSYDDDFVARNVLTGLLRYVERHPHSSCQGFFRRLRLKDKGMLLPSEASEAA